MVFECYLFLTNWGRVIHICALVAWTAPSHYLNQCWNIVDWAHRNKFLWKWNSYIFIQENVIETSSGQRRSFFLSFGVLKYRQVSNISRTLAGNTIVDHSDVVGAAPVAPTTSSFSTEYLASIAWAKTTARRDEKHLKCWVLVRLILDIWR